MTDVSKSSSVIVSFLIHVIVMRKMFLSIGCQMKSTVYAGEMEL